MDRAQRADLAFRMAGVGFIAWAIAWLPHKLAPVLRWAQQVVAEPGAQGKALEALLIAVSMTGTLLLLGALPL